MRPCVRSCVFLAVLASLCPYLCICQSVIGQAQSVSPSVRLIFRQYSRGSENTPYVCASARPPFNLLFSIESVRQCLCMCFPFSSPSAPSVCPSVLLIVRQQSRESTSKLWWQLFLYQDIEACPESVDANARVTFFCKFCLASS